MSELVKKAEEAVFFLLATKAEKKAERYLSAERITKCMTVDAACAGLAMIGAVCEAVATHNVQGEWLVVLKPALVLYWTNIAFAAWLGRSGGGGEGVLVEDNTEEKYQELTLVSQEV